MFLRRRRAIPVFVILLAVMAGCAAPQASPTSTSAPVPSQVATTTPPSTPTTEAPPSETPAPQPEILPSPYDGQLPDGAAAVLGLGRLDPSVSPDGRFFAVESSAGTRVIDFGTLKTLWQTPLTGVEWRTDGRTVRTGREIREIATGNLIRTQEPATGWRVMSPDENVIATRSSNLSDIILSDANTGAFLHRLPPPVGVGTAAYHGQWTAYAWFSPHTRLVATTYQWGEVDQSDTGQAVGIWDIATGNLIHIIPAVANEVSWSPDGKTLMPISYHGMSLWSTADWTQIGEYDPSGYWMVWSPDGSMFANEDGLYESATGKQVRDLHAAYRAVWSQDGKYLAWQQRLGDESSVQVLNAQTLATAYAIDDAWMPIGISGDNSRILILNPYTETLTAWELKSGGRYDAALTLRGTGAVNALAWSPDGRTVASGAGYAGDRAGVGLWNVPDAHPITFHLLAPGELIDWNFHVVSITWLKSRPALLYATAGAHTGLLDPNTLAPVPANIPAATSMRQSPDGARIAAIHNSDGLTTSRIEIWDAATGSPVKSLELPQGAITAFGWSPDGATLAIITASGATYWASEPSDVGTLTFWNVDSGQTTSNPVGFADMPFSLAWSPDGTQIAIGFRQSAAIWNVADGKITRTLENPSEKTRELVYVDIAWSPDGRTIAAAHGRNPEIRECNGCPFYLKAHAALWDAQTGDVLRVFDTQTAEIEAVAFSPDGSLLATGSWDGTIIVWKVPD